MNKQMVEVILRTYVAMMVTLSAWLWYPLSRVK